MSLCLYDNWQCLYVLILVNSLSADFQVIVTSIQTVILSPTSTPLRSTANTSSTATSGTTSGAGGGGGGNTLSTNSNGSDWTDNNYSVDSTTSPFPPETPRNNTDLMNTGSNVSTGAIVAAAAAVAAANAAAASDNNQQQPQIPNVVSLGSGKTPPDLQQQSELQIQNACHHFS